MYKIYRSDTNDAQNNSNLLSSIRHLFLEIQLPAELRFGVLYGGSILPIQASRQVLEYIWCIQFHTTSKVCRWKF